MVKIFCLPQISVTDNIVDRRTRSPTILGDEGKISGPGRSARRRRLQTLNAAKMLHGATAENMTPAYAGLIAVLNESAPVSVLIDAIIKCAKFTKKVIPKIVKQKINIFEKSQTNFIRSVNILYRGGITSKQKYNSIRSSLTMGLDDAGVKRKHIEFMSNIPVPKLLSYKEVLKKINEIDIGDLHDVGETLCKGLKEEDMVDGKYRDLLKLLLKMAQFYLSANNYRKDKLNWFGKQEGTFKVAIGGDGAPFGKDDQALAWLVSFLNCGQRVCSSAENFLLIGANCSEDCEPVRRYVVLLERQMTEIEGKMFLVEIDGKEKFVSFQFELLPNDMKYLAFLGGELSISASYFSPFADINKKDIANTQENFGSKPQDKWHPWKYSQRLRVAAAVKEKKEEVSKTTLKPATKREKITSFISQKKSRQEFLPLVGKFIDRAKAEPLHLKNNAWQQWNSSVLMYSLSRSHLGECESISDVSPNSCFGKYYHTIRFNVKATRLAKKIRKWFAGDRTKNKPLEYRFTGKESRLFCHNFMYIVESLKTDEDQNVHTFKLHVFAYTGLNLRDSVSLFSRISMSSEQVQSLSQVCSNYFRATALFLKSTPTSWTIGHVVPVHAQQLQETLGLGLGINTMEGREAKHVTLAKFTNNAQYNNRWSQVFKHEYISLFWLRENGCDETVYKHTSNVYIPKRCFTHDFCYCGLPKDGNVEKCSFCSQHFQKLVSDCVLQGKTTLEAKEAIK